MNGPRFAAFTYREKWQPQKFLVGKVFSRIETRIEDLPNKRGSYIN